jgi:hypothetical protein
MKTRNLRFAVGSFLSSVCAKRLACPWLLLEFVYSALLLPCLGDCSFVRTL